MVGSAEHLLKAMPGVVRRRDGGVLTRGFILKTDHYPTGRALGQSDPVSARADWIWAGRNEHQKDEGRNAAELTLSFSFLQTCPSTSPARQTSEA